MIVHLVAEGYMEAAVAVRLLPFCGHKLGDVYGQYGCAYIREKAAKFHHLATACSGVLVLTDFRDAGAECIVDALQDYIWKNLPSPPASFLCRFAVNELESWLLADRGGLAKFFGIALTKMPLQPESEPLPKRTLVALARRSRKKKIREGIVPAPGHKGAVAPGYLPLMCEFIANFWNIEAAMRCAPSLERCVSRLREFPQDKNDHVAKNTPGKNR
jgi:hypothetical protein